MSGRSQPPLTNELQLTGTAGFHPLHAVVRRWLHPLSKSLLGLLVRLWHELKKGQVGSPLFTARPNTIKYLPPNDGVLQSGADSFLPKFCLCREEIDDNLVASGGCRNPRGDGHSLLLLVHRDQYASPDNLL